jgi:hypothetical protein
MPKSVKKRSAVVEDWAEAMETGDQQVSTFLFHPCLT